MEKKIQTCKHGVYTASCSYCKDYDKAKVEKEKNFEDIKKSWFSESYHSNSSFNSAFGDQDYDIEEKNLDDDSSDKK